uniref:Uncharacterized protein n=1 Tax=Oryzias latipes TaxID=8090 RepID=A0A3P9KWW0_ORYLA
MSSEKPVSAPPSSASSLADSDSHLPLGFSCPPPAQVAAGAGSGSGSTAERMVSAAGSMVLPAGVINPAVPIRNIQMKFAVLVGLIQVGEVSNRDIVETVLNLVSESVKKYIYILKGSHENSRITAHEPLCFIYDATPRLCGFQRMMSFVCAGDEAK